VTILTAFITHTSCLEHDNGYEHPESPARLVAIEKRLQQTGLLQDLQKYDAPRVTREQLNAVHSSEYLDLIEKNAPTTASDFIYLDPDTRMSMHTLEAAARAAGATILAVDKVIAQEVNNAFCAVRPPGHHAKKQQAMGFCLYNNVMVGIAHALTVHGLDRVALLDFDVHHGNGSEDILLNHPDLREKVLFCSSFQHPFYPNEPFTEDDPQLIFTPMPAGASGVDFRERVESRWLPAIEKFKPQMIFISAGFDAHHEDFLASINLNETDYQWITEQAVALANQHASGRIVSVLEGGYHTEALARSVEVHIRSLMQCGD
jgi:acetoin utilization deacetylase AcuC-like enzyme